MPEYRCDIIGPCKTKTSQDQDHPTTVVCKTDRFKDKQHILHNAEKLKNRHLYL